MNKRLAIIVCVILVLVGSALITRSSRLVPQADDSSIAPDNSPRPSPTWASLPLRASESERGGEVDYRPFYRALLRDQIEEADRLWTELCEMVPEESGSLHIAGARLALAQDDLERAGDRAREAVSRTPDDALAWSLLGVILDRTGQPRQAEQALAKAQSLDPSLASEVLPSRWQAAVASRDAAVVVALAENFGERYPGNIFVPYYRAEALLMTGAPSDAITLLVGVLTEEPDAPALLWYTLGRAYLARGGYIEAATSLEAAAYRFARGDTSLELISPRPIDDLNAHLGQAYLQTARCAEAETIFHRLQADQPGFAGMVEAAVNCQTPTPTLTPWIPVQIGTVTPRP
ncbi:MAG: tetratricopeptide repeat protein [Anaerolineae bacterium]|nr:tetratricopeptide repeat protein [Anaerolineae bacterium]